MRRKAQGHDGNLAHHPLVVKLHVSFLSQCVMFSHPLCVVLWYPGYCVCLCVCVRAALSPFRRPLSLAGLTPSTPYARRSSVESSSDGGNEGEEEEEVESPAFVTMTTPVAGALLPHASSHGVPIVALACALACVLGFFLSLVCFRLGR